ncbi:ketoacyl-ACP synthase III [Aequorivita viscosa]|uniref:3-oxoacyl-[acyl-carrier-protein] synthase-3 n=1 Tax=Aequorivita viscosa TaxID=797419 RepID=A0A1M6MV54_9FLAO|nr:ketoacyl-ACP synthase III [Aequorivita viscosa]SDX37104.1 3-oxoacyl-[acyl-carrier-protein] synthase-3 [Aequorivita viscosa]SHJ87334.1 3-oxoacyl-[acyl-carrier-protein] synthase-3 [Aequorivita viscosa]
MAFFSIQDIAVKGIAAAVPSNMVSNWDYDLLTESEKKLLIKTTGVEQRRMVLPGMTTSDLCFEAAEKLLKELHWKKEEIEILIFVSQSTDFYLPATAIILQDRLGLSKSCMAFDIGLGCSGYVYGLSVISGMMKATGLKKGLLMVGDISTATCSNEDKSTYPLFGDAGTVTALQYEENAKSISFDLNSDGSGKDAIIIPHGGLRNLASPESFVKEEITPGIVRSKMDLALNGLDVFNFSIKEVPNSLKEFLEKIGTTTESYDYFVMHQANKLMNETIRKKMKFAPEKVPYSISKYGNTSSASIPLTIVSELSNDLKNSEKKLLLAGFGVGLSWGSVSLNLKNVVLPEIIEL